MVDPRRCPGEGRDSAPLRRTRRSSRTRSSAAMWDRTACSRSASRSQIRPISRTPDGPATLSRYSAAAPSGEPGSGSGRTLHRAAQASGSDGRSSVARAPRSSAVRATSTDRSVHARCSRVSRRSSRGPQSWSCPPRPGRAASGGLGDRPMPPTGRYPTPDSSSRASSSGTARWPNRSMKSVRNRSSPGSRHGRPAVCKASMPWRTAAMTRGLIDDAMAGRSASTWNGDPGKVGPGRPPSAVAT